MNKIKVLMIVLMSYVATQNAYVTPAWPNQSGPANNNAKASSNTLPSMGFTLPGASWGNSSSSSSSSYGGSSTPAANNDDLTLDATSEWDSAAASSD